MNQYSKGFKWGMSAILFVLILLIAPLALASDVGIVGVDVPIVFGTEAVGVAQDGVSDGETVVDAPQDEGFFVRYDIAGLLILLFGAFGFWLYRLQPPGSQQTYLKTLDALSNALEYLKDLPGARYDAKLQSAIDAINTLKVKIGETAPPPPSDPLYAGRHPDR